MISVIIFAGVLVGIAILLGVLRHANRWARLGAVCLFGGLGVAVGALAAPDDSLIGLVALGYAVFAVGVLIALAVLPLDIERQRRHRAAAVQRHHGPAFVVKPLAAARLLRVIVIYAVIVCGAVAAGLLMDGTTPMALQMVILAVAGSATMIGFLYGCYLSVLTFVERDRLDSQIRTWALTLPAAELIAWQLDDALIEAQHRTFRRFQY